MNLALAKLQEVDQRKEEDEEAEVSDDDKDRAGLVNTVRPCEAACNFELTSLSKWVVNWSLPELVALFLQAVGLFGSAGP